MTRHENIQRIVARAAAANLGAKSVGKVISEPTVDSEGRDALKITIVIKPASLSRLEGDAVLDTLLQIQEGLRKAGDERLAIVEYATEDELAAGADTES